MTQKCKEMHTSDTKVQKADVCKFTSHTKVQQSDTKVQLQRHRERESEAQRERERETQRERERHTDRERERHRETERERDRQREETETHTERHRETERDRETKRLRDTERERERLTSRFTKRCACHEISTLRLTRNLHFNIHMRQPDKAFRRKNASKDNKQIPKHSFRKIPPDF